MFLITISPFWGEKLTLRPFFLENRQNSSPHLFVKWGGPPMINQNHLLHFFVTTVKPVIIKKKLISNLTIFHLQNFKKLKE